MPLLLKEASSIFVLYTCEHVYVLGVRGPELIRWKERKKSVGVEINNGSANQS